MNDPVMYVDVSGELAWPGEVHQSVVKHIKNNSNGYIEAEKRIDYENGLFGRADLVGKEGEIWEAANTAHKYELDNLIVFVDFNNLQIDGTCDQVMPNGDLGEKFKSFGWEVMEIDGHNMEEICATLDKCYASKNGKPKCIYAHTIKGKGVSYMENSCAWHGVAPNKEERDQAMEELTAQLV